MRGYFFALIATAIWSGNFIIARGLSESIPPVSLAFWRWVVAVIVFLPFALRHLLAERMLLKEHLRYLSVTAALGITVFNTLIYIAGHTTSALNLSLIAITFPIFIVVLMRLFYRERISIKQGAGICLVAIGVVLLITKGDPSILLSISFAVGDIWMLAASLTFAIYSIQLKRKPKHLSVWTMQLSTFLLGLLIFVAVFSLGISFDPGYSMVNNNNWLNSLCRHICFVDRLCPLEQGRPCHWADKSGDDLLHITAV